MLGSSHLVFYFIFTRTLHGSDDHSLLTNEETQAQIKLMICLSDRAEIWISAQAMTQS